MIKNKSDLFIGLLDRQWSKDCYEKQCGGVNGGTTSRNAKNSSKATGHRLQGSFVITAPTCSVEAFQYGMMVHLNQHNYLELAKQAGIVAASRDTVH